MNQLAKVLLYQQSEIEAKLQNQEAIIGRARKGTAGLTLDEDKTPEWKTAKQRWDFWFAELRKVNAKLNKQRKCIGYDNQNGKRIPIYRYKD